MSRLLASPGPPGAGGAKGDPGTPAANAPIKALRWQLSGSVTCSDVSLTDVAIDPTNAVGLGPKTYVASGGENVDFSISYASSATSGSGVQYFFLRHDLPGGGSESILSNASSANRTWSFSNLAAGTHTFTPMYDQSGSRSTTYNTGSALEAGLKLSYFEARATIWPSTA